MQLKTVCILALALIPMIIADDSEEIKVEVITPAPEDCERKSKKNDMLSMHYTGTLTETGVKFDSR